MTVILEKKKKTKYGSRGDQRQNKKRCTLKKKFHNIVQALWRELYTPGKQPEKVCTSVKKPAGTRICDTVFNSDPKI